MNADHDDHDDHGLATALRDRLDDVHPDLDRLVAAATRQGTRLRRRTRLAVSIGSVAGAAAVAATLALGSSWAGSDPSGAPRRAAFADEPSSSPSSSSPSPSTVPTTPAVSSGMAPHLERSPVSLELAGWGCTPPGDEKFICTSDGSSVVVNWRPADERADWGSDPDKSADWISDVHGRFFVTVVAGPHTPAIAAAAVGEALIWSQ